MFATVHSVLVQAQHDGCKIMNRNSFADSKKKKNAFGSFLTQCVHEIERGEELVRLYTPTVHSFIDKLSKSYPRARSHRLNL